MCSLSRSPAPVVGVRRLAKIPQRFRNLLCGVCHGDIVPFLGPVPERSFLSQTASLVLGGALAKTTIRAVAGPGASVSPTAYRPATGHTGQGGRGQALLDRIVLRRAARRDRARDRGSTKPPSGFPVVAASPPGHQSRQIARSRCRGLPANRTGEVRVARGSSAHKRRGTKRHEAVN